jgi:hypothetical protein
MLPIYYEIQATIKADKPIGGWKSNAYVIFDYFSPTDFKFAGINISIDKIQMGRRTPEGWIVDVQDSAKLKPNIYYNMLVAVNGTAVTVVVDGKDVFSHVFEPRIIDGFSYGLNQGMVGFGSDNSRGIFDNCAVQILPPEITFDETEDFNDGAADRFTGASEGDWVVDKKRYEGDPAGSDQAFSLMDLGLGRGLEARSLLQLEATFGTQSMSGIVFDFYGPQDFKFAAVDAVTDQVIVGHRTAKRGWSYDVSVDWDIQAGTDYTLFVSLKGSTVSVSIDGQVILGYVYNAVTVDGAFGLITMNGAASFDEVRVKTDDPGFEEEGQNLLAASAALDPDNAIDLSYRELTQIAAEAKARWIASGYIDDARLALLNAVAFEIADLDGLALGYTIGTAVQIDVDAAGHGWFVDPSPQDDGEFQIASDEGTPTEMALASSEGMDLLTVVMHEIGHVIGYDDISSSVDEDSIMTDVLDVGERRTEIKTLSRSMNPPPGLAQAKGELLRLDGSATKRPRYPEGTGLEFFFHQAHRFEDAWVWKFLHRCR